MAAQDARNCADCGRHPCVCDAFDAALGLGREDPPSPPPTPLKRAHATVGVKQPRSSIFPVEEVVEDIDDDGDAEVLDNAKDYHKKFKQSLMCSESYSHDPDLAAYFDDFHLSAQQRIGICRTYANYLTQKLRSSGKMAPARTNKRY